MNSPAPVPPPATATPQATPTAWGIGQALITSYLTMRAATAFGLPPEYSAVLAGGVASGITSGLHALAQRWHLDGK